MLTRKSRPFPERLWEKIDKRGPDDCWLWTAGKAGKGYGSIRKRINDKWVFVYAHREVLTLTKGDPPTKEHQALHSCDTFSCCNPAHLSWGTESHNRRQARDRLHNQGNQKLKPDQVAAIKQDPRTYKEIADEYAVHLSTISLIKRNRSWHP